MKHDVAVVMTTVCRDSLIRAVHSVYVQNYSGKIQVLVGVDFDPEQRSEQLHKMLDDARPGNVELVWLDLHYSTSKRHGGVHDCLYGGALRSALTLLANAEIVVYLDDDDWLHADHIAQVLAAIQGKKWAFAYSIYADGNTAEPLCTDEIESVGVDKGIYRSTYGGFVRPSGLAINKLKLLKLVHLWACSPFASGDGEDRLIFFGLRGEEHACTGNPTVYVTIDPKDSKHNTRIAYMAAKGIAPTLVAKIDSAR
jgi:hypothetical protein